MLITLEEEKMIDLVIEKDIDDAFINNSLKRFFTLLFFASNNFHITGFDM